MDVNQIRSNIYYNDDLIDQYNVEKRKIENQLQELEQLRNKFTSLQNKFGEKQNKRQQALSRYSKSRVFNNIFSKYVDGMHSLLYGSKFNDTYNGLFTAKKRINKEIEGLVDKLDDYERKITYRRNRKAYWQNQLTIALREAEK